MQKTTAYRYPNEQLVLGITIVLVLAVIAISATATFCLSAVFVLVMVIVAAYLNKNHHKALMKKAFPVSVQTTPLLAESVTACAARLQPGSVDVFLLRSREMNAYTFGLETPKVIVLYEALLNVMDMDELQFVIGHEMGHVALGHTWLNTLVGGMAGIPAPYAAAILLYTVFMAWNRNCEYSADRAGLLACGSLEKAISALVKLAAPGVRSLRDYDQALTVLDKEDDDFSNRAAEAFQTHPMIIKRINQLKQYADTAEYRRLQALVDRNVQAAPR